MKEQLKCRIIDALKNLHKTRGEHSLRAFRLCEIVHELMESDAPFTKQVFLQAMHELVKQERIEFMPINKARSHQDNPLFVNHFRLPVPKEFRPIEGSWLERQLEHNSREVGAWPTWMRQDRDCPCTKIVHALIGIHAWEEELSELLSLRESVV